MSRPQALSRSTAAGLDPATVGASAKSWPRKTGKPADVLEKIIELGLKTYYKEVCRHEQVS